jgi:hypothetical protein
MIVIVTGMYHSGTSILAELFHANNIYMVKNKNNQFQSINNYILSLNRYSVKTLSPMTPEGNIIITEQAQSIIRSLLYAYDKKYTTWGFQDPCMCLTYSAWKSLLQKPYTDQDIKIILIQRNFEDIADSMIAKEYYKRIFKDIDFYDFTAIIEFEDLINRPKETAAFLSKQLNLPITDISFINKNL